MNISLLILSFIYILICIYTYIYIYIYLHIPEVPGRRLFCWAAPAFGQDQKLTKRALLVPIFCVLVRCRFFVFPCCIFGPASPLPSCIMFSVETKKRHWTELQVYEMLRFMGGLCIKWQVCPQTYSFQVDPSLKNYESCGLVYPRLIWLCFRISSCCCSTRSTLYFTKRGAVFESTIQRLNGRTNSSFSMDPDRSASILGWRTLNEMSECQGLD